PRPGRAGRGRPGPPLRRPRPPGTPRPRSFAPLPAAPPVVHVRVEPAAVLDVAGHVVHSAAVELPPVDPGAVDLVAAAGVDRAVGAADARPSLGRNAADAAVPVLVDGARLVDVARLPVERVPPPPARLLLRRRRPPGQAGHQLGDGLRGQL